jgi:hypothetical protein
MAETTRRQDAATATIGLAGVGGAGALRHTGLERAYGGGKRPLLAQELKLIRRGTRGRGTYLSGAALGLLSVPPAAVGTARLLGNKTEKITASKRESRKKKTFLEEGLTGVRRSLAERTDTVTSPAPVKLMAANYLGGAAIGSAAGGLVHRGLSSTRFPGAGRSALAAATGVAAGAATLPVQSKLIERASHGKYVATSTGVRRRKAKAVRPSELATVVEGRPGKSTIHPHALREQMGPVSKGPINTAGAHLGAHWTVNGLRLADKIDVPDRRMIPKTRRGKLVHTGRTKTANAVRSASFDVGSINDKDAMMRNTVHGNPLFEEEQYLARTRSRKDYALAKRAGEEYYGQHLSRGQKRARVIAAGATPFIGDYTSAAAAASMAPPELRKKTALWHYGAAQTGQAVGTLAGGYGLVHAAKHPAVKAKVEAANDAIDSGMNAVRTSLGRKPKTGPGAILRAAESSKVPSAVRGALRPLAKNPKVAAVGMLAGGMAGSQGGGYLGHGHALNLERERNARLRRANPAGRRGVSKRDSKVLTSDEHRKQARKKRIAANVATFTGLTGTGALSALGASKIAQARGAVRGAKTLEGLQTPLLTAGAGVGGLGSFNFAAMQRREARTEQAQVKKGLLATGIRRAPSMRRGSIRQTRYAGGVIRTSAVRGGLA